MPTSVCLVQQEEHPAYNYEQPGTWGRLFLRPIMFGQKSSNYFVSQISSKLGIFIYL
jgi:hypothetical protein